MRLALAMILCGGAACSLVTVQQDPLPVLDVRAPRPVVKRPPPPKPPGRVAITQSAITIADKVQFETGSAEILPVSYPLLDEVAQVLTDNPQIELVQVEGHTDSTGDVKFNRTLSQQRAESVMKYLGGKGINVARLVAKGFGPDKPIADNATTEGRDQNRRVEFNIVKQGDKKVQP
jgi:outer membrane protein OmpA-like peptidoglycan-associated protein